MTAARLSDKDFIEKSILLYKEYNKHKLMYKDFDTYDQLVTADPFVISKSNLKNIESKGQILLNWIKEQKEFFKEVLLNNDKSFDWLRELLENDASKETISYQKEILKREPRYSSIMRADLSSLPYGCHEAQLRWGGLPHINYINELYDRVIEDYSTLSPNKSISIYIQKIVDQYTKGDNETCLYLSPDKYIQGNLFAANNTLKNVNVTLVEDLNEQNFDIKKSKLIQKSTGQTISLIFRRQISLETLVETEFGRKLIDLYLQGAIRFEPDLDFINDMKIGMPLVFDSRTRSFFSNESRSLFLKTSFADKKLESFNSVYNTDFDGTENFIQNTTKSKRKYIFKYGGMDMFMSFGGGEVYRLDDSENNVRKILEKNHRLWIMQDMDTARFSFRYLQGDYNKPKTCTIGQSDRFSARLELFYYVQDDTVELATTLANLVNDHWKARFKTSDQEQGRGSLVTPIHVEQ